MSRGPRRRPKVPVPIHAASILVRSTRKNPSSAAQTWTHPPTTSAFSTCITRAGIPGGGALRVAA
eukprot:CAMPEP_0194303220 /NCGR_PEP_ID=MMETSP0171-20130528/1137_1 /TAXON_ID=218684 /ORGANISM="Corethron pennatum, Strain L29A3" /LENGTH=64 /DNA_ID=CAMNT_0039054039 /DNA_START=255 /DNA_END=446 /DNA_ORIENTATION=-